MPCRRAKYTCASEAVARRRATIDLEEARYSPRAVSQITMLPHAAAIEDPNLCAMRFTSGTPGKAARSVADYGLL